MNSIQQTILAVAKKYIGETEKPSNMGFNSKVFEEKMLEVGFQKTQAWCSYFAELVWKEAYRLLKKEHVVINLDKYFSASATKTFANFSAAPMVTVSDVPVEGALVIWKKGSTWMGHVGIVSKVNADESFETIEGNGNDKGGREGYKVVEMFRKLELAPSKTGMYILGFVHPIL